VRREELAQDHFASGRISANETDNSMFPAFGVFVRASDFCHFSPSYGSFDPGIKGQALIPLCRLWDLAKFGPNGTSTKAVNVGAG
jgi:hypothetical protein